MKELGVVICNFNKSDYIIKCIETVLSSTFKDMDVYVVDNASTDDSVEKINSAYKDRITLLRNSENLGGSGGFNTGIRKAMEIGYPYIMCIDNDVLLKEDAIEKLYVFLKENPDVGMAASKIMIMDSPDTIQTHGAMIDFEKYKITDCYRNEKDGEGIPKIQYCDYVPACALMVKREVIKKIGMMPEENFIYWDDMEWGYRVNLSGKKVASYGESIVWHKGGVVSGNTFWKYYQYRNRINFFLRYISEEKIDDFCEFILKEIYRQIFGCYEKEDLNTIKSLMFALDDVLCHNLGKAGEGRILDRRPLRNPLSELVKDKDKIALAYPLGVKKENLEQCLFNINKVSGKKADMVLETKLHEEDYDLVLHFCLHVFDIEKGNPDWNYIDIWNNCNVNVREFYKLTNYKEARKDFISLYRNIFISHALDISRNFKNSKEYMCLKN